MTDVWKWEMEMCCSMHIESLYKQLLQCRQQDITTSIHLAPACAAAPHDETLFDSVMLSLKTTADSTFELRGAVSYWSPVRGHHGQSTTIRTFTTADECIEWMRNTNAASEECAVRSWQLAMDESCHSLRQEGLLHLRYIKQPIMGVFSTLVIGLFLLFFYHIIQKTSHFITMFHHYLINL